MIFSVSIFHFPARQKAIFDDQNGKMGVQELLISIGYNFIMYYRQSKLRDVLEMAKYHFVLQAMYTMAETQDFSTGQNL